MTFFQVIAELQSCGTRAYNQVLNIDVRTHLSSLDDLNNGNEGWIRPVSRSLLIVPFSLN